MVRDPRQRTPAAGITDVTNDGIQLFSSTNKVKTPSRMAKGRRFDEYYWLQKNAAVVPGPGNYRPATELKDRLIKQACIKIRKSHIIDEQCYEIVGNGSRVLQPHLLKKFERQAFEIAQNSMPPKTSETFLHQRIARAKIRDGSAISASTTLSPQTQTLQRTDDLKRV